jgi:hypothetical protein
MSIILKLNKNLTKLGYDYKLLQNKHIIFASYSRRSNSKNSDSPYKIVKAKIGNISSEILLTKFTIFLRLYNRYIRNLLTIIVIRKLMTL